MAKNWWKILGIGLLIYASSFTFLAPLDPGILGVENGQVEPGNAEVLVIGYNTHFDTESASMQTFMQSGDVRICGMIAEIVSPTRVKIAFDIPQNLPLSLADVYVNNDHDGTVYLPNALSISNLDKNAPIPSNCNITVNTNSFEGFGFPFLPTIFETIRNLIFHVPMWFTMFFIMIVSFSQSIVYLSKGKIINDIRAEQAVQVGLVFCVLGLVTGSIWARFTWGAWWLNDPQLNGAMATFLIYAAYMILRKSIPEENKRGRIAAVYNIFAFVMLVVLLMILPKFTESLHPGKGGTPAFSSYDLDSSLRAVFYPAVIGWIIVGYWMYKIRLRYVQLLRKVDYDE